MSSVTKTKHKQVFTTALSVKCSDEQKQQKTTGIHSAFIHARRNRDCILVTDKKKKKSETRMAANVLKTRSKQY